MSLPDEVLAALRARVAEIGQEQMALQVKATCERSRKRTMLSSERLAELRSIAEKRHGLSGKSLREWAWEEDFDPDVVLELIALAEIGLAAVEEERIVRVFRQRLSDDAEDKGLWRAQHNQAGVRLEELCDALLAEHEAAAEREVRGE